MRNTEQGFLGHFNKEVNIVLSTLPIYRLQVLHCQRSIKADKKILNDVKSLSVILTGQNLSQLLNLSTRGGFMIIYFIPK